MASFPALGLDVTFSSNGAIPVTAESFDASGQDIVFNLTFQPQSFREFTVINNSGLDFITGRFNNLEQGQLVRLNYNGRNIYYVADYFGGTGNDLVLRRYHCLVFSWGANEAGQADWGTPSEPRLTSRTGGSVGAAMSMAVGGQHSLLVNNDGSVYAWGSNTKGQLGKPRTTSHLASVSTEEGVSALFERRVVAVSAGAEHSLALCDDGVVLAWGDNSSGQLGDGTSNNREVPVEVSRAAGASALAGRKVVAIAAGSTFSLALCSDGAIVAWGANESGQLGDGSTVQRLAPVRVSEEVGVSALAGRSPRGIAAGGAHALALCADGSVVAWGAGGYGQLGNGGGSSTVPVAVSTTTALAGLTVTQVAAGQSFSAARCSNGVICTWGRNSEGQLGNSSGVDTALPVGIQISPSFFFTAVQAGKNHCVAITSYGGSLAWGDNSYKQLAMEGYPWSSQPWTLDAAVAFDQWNLGVAAGSSSNHNLAAISPTLGSGSLHVTANGSPIALGAINLERTELGSAPPPIDLELANFGGGDAADITLVLSGPNAADFAVTQPAITTLPPEESTSVALQFTPSAAGRREATLTISSSSAATVTIALRCQVPGEIPAVFTTSDDLPLTTNGFDTTGSTLALTLPPAPTFGQALTVINNTSSDFIKGEFSGFTQGQTLSATAGRVRYEYVVNYYGGTGNDLVLEWKNCQMFGWGRNTQRQIAPFGSSLIYIPTEVMHSAQLQGRTVVRTACGSTASWALTVDGVLFKWGDGNAEPTPFDVTGSVLEGRFIVDIAVGATHILALCADGTVAAWGTNNTYGQFGDGTTTASAVPVAVSTASTSYLNGRSVVAIAAGSYHSLALLSNGSVAAWGKNDPAASNGASTVGAVLEPEYIVGTGTTSLHAIAIAAAGNHSMLLTATGRVGTWGSDVYGEAGVNGVPSTAQPVTLISALTFSAPVTEISAGTVHCLARCSDGKLYGWGSGSGFAPSPSNYKSPILIDAANASAIAGRNLGQILATERQSYAGFRDGGLAAWGLGGATLGTAPGSSKALPAAVSEVDVPEGGRFIRLPRSSLGPHCIAVAALPPVGKLQIANASGPVTAGSWTEDFGDVQAGGTAATVTFVLTNSGDAPLTLSGITATGDTEDFIFAAPEPAVLEMAENLNLAVTFHPTQSGPRTATLAISAGGEVFTLTLTGNGQFSVSGAAAVAWSPSPQIAAVGASITLRTVADGQAPLNYQWSKNGRNISGARQSTLVIASAALANAGLFKCTVSNDTGTASALSELAVVDTALRRVDKLPGSSTTLKVQAAGAGLSFQWFKDNELLPEATSSTLTLTKLTLSDMALYHCRVRAPGRWLDGGRYDLRIIDHAPTFIIPEDGVLPTGLMLDEYSYQVVTDNTRNLSAARYSASGLPTGLRIDPSSGLISGVPQRGKATHYLVTLSASNVRGTTRAKVQLPVLPLPQGAVGRFVAPLLQEADPETGLGGRIDLNVSQSGAYSGRLTWGARSYPFRGKVKTNIEFMETYGTCVISRGRSREPVTFDFALPANDNALYGSLEMTSGYTHNIIGWRNVWSRQMPADRFARLYTHELAVYDTLQGIAPGGKGFFSMNLNPTSGTVTLVGKLADGSPMTGSTFMSQQGEVAVFQLLYSSTARGSLAGTFVVREQSAEDWVNLLWYKPLSSSRSSPSGFLALLRGTGGPYVPPVAPGLVMGLNPDAPDNAQLTFTLTDEQGLGLDPDPSIALTVGARHLVTLPSERPSLTTITLNPTRGTFSGTFLLRNPNPLNPSATITRKVSYQGLIRPSPTDSTQGVGFFVVPSLPDTLGETISNTPLSSGTVLLNPVTTLPL